MTLKKLDRALPLALLHAREATLKPFRQELDDIGLTVQQWRVIRVLAEGKPCCATELAERCVLMPPSLSRILKTLTERGLIERIEDTDARRRRVQITTEGCRRYTAMSQKAAGIYEDLEEKFGAEKMETLLDLLNELYDVARAA
ncbi:homoprotocatechuate degradation operon regulator, HpaR [Aliiroseovarius halocynthiae]|uniref:Homoprotocatechuate degradation operon regulator HpaR n=1 Tax=Aliiroseovarius halocynthiae TaxID=985055 RepID=A0A545SSI0_9RHOB|nr:homoprotocatechuate degradation operon regulator HpaR [Aliiroseovarius halocynthiae]TQV67923.1 homoprotocatechuate degradation operon regulator HpaR [Aliiroseovarius halocynthiae]SMR73024.1 homoprotocatechuate degradation operon regulator, HpaR [Aliiroseovarius halocynthiae]